MKLDDKQLEKVAGGGSSGSRFRGYVKYCYGEGIEYDEYLFKTTIFTDREACVSETQAKAAELAALHHCQTEWLVAEYDGTDHTLSTLSWIQ